MRRHLRRVYAGLLTIFSGLTAAAAVALGWFLLIGFIARLVFGEWGMNEVLRESIWNFMAWSSLIVSTFGAAYIIGMVEDA